jgi:hypothetical protein
MLKLALTTREESVKPEVLEGYWIEEANGKSLCFYQSTLSNYP